MAMTQLSHELVGLKPIPLAIGLSSSGRQSGPGTPKSSDSLVKYIGNDYCDFIHISRYARFMEDIKRRESWSETVRRTVNYLCEKQKGSSTIVFTDESVKAALYSAIFERRVMPSMRVMQTAGPAMDKDNMCAYNCSYIAMEDVSAFSEILYVLMCGAGAGFSCERRYTEKLPVVPATLCGVDKTITVADNREGWVSCVRYFMDRLYRGEIWKVDYSQLRLEGAKLKTMGGRASGPEPLKQLMSFLVQRFLEAAGRKLKPIDVHHIVCKIGNIVVMGGVRRRVQKRVKTLIIN